MILIFILIQFSQAVLLKNKPFYIGTYMLRASNDPVVKNKFSFLVLNDDDTIKLKTINQDAFIANKISRSGKIKELSNKKIFVKFNNVNKYSYSIFGIEIPELKYEQITNYTNQKTLDIKLNENSILIEDKNMNYYYIFDLNNANQKIKLPYIEITFATLISTQFISFIVNLILMKYINFF